MKIVTEIANKFFFDTVVYRINKNIFIKDYKSYLQEYFHKGSSTKILYTLIAERGPDHDKEFDMCVSIDDIISGYGTGKNKKQAEQQAARDALLKAGAISE